MNHETADGIYAEFAQRFNAGDVEGLLDLYEADAVFVRGPGDHVAGRDAIRAALQSYLDTGGKISFETRHAVRHGDIALLSNEYTLQGIDREGRPFTLTGKTAEVLRLQPDGRWLYLIDHPAGAQD
ncbi:MAG: SgcJ/EcaC family oxidoreductase [Gammaproteobacteria bacterium]|nr:SgcJ/EcaC family oxidoreductase [Gammaproteobacteria bacterium]MBI5616482.1 SgcJ/EcaC family oxidoreductase [Gammaproteobacteria bacterium]